MEWWADAERALQDIPHAVAGAVATNAYAPERLTRDLDLAVMTVDAGRAEAALRAAGWLTIGRLALVRGTSWQDVAGNNLDLIELTDPWAAEAVAAAQDNRIAGMPTLPMKYLVFMKPLASRTTDLGDVSRMLGRASVEHVEDARAIVVRFGGAEDLADFDQLVRMGQLERASGPGSAAVDSPS